MPSKKPMPAEALALAASNSSSALPDNTAPQVAALPSTCKNPTEQMLFSTEVLVGAVPKENTPGGEAAKTPRPTAAKKTAKPRAKQAAKGLKSAKTGLKTVGRVAYRPEFCQQLLAFFDVPPFKVTEVQKKDGSISFVESASELPTFAAFARTLGVTQSILQDWQDAHPAFAEAAKKARDLQGDILIQNSLRGNYSASFAVFTAKNLLGWTDGKDDAKKPLGTVVVRWEKE